MVSKNKNDVVVQAIEAMKKSEFGLTGVKIELESQFNRGYSNNSCPDCDEGRVECGDCSGYGEHECSQCEGSGTVRCSECDAYGMIPNPAFVSRSETPDEPASIRCHECDSDYEVECDECLGNCEVSCGDCEGVGNHECVNCNGESERTNFNDVAVCHDFILERLVPLGLAEEKENGDDYDYAYKYKPKHPLVFSKFYNDGSVDSELTFTLSVEDPSVVLHLPRFIEIFNELGEAIGNGSRTEGAGMHMALLNSEEAYYPTNISTADHNRFRNFNKSMSLLMPALFFLGSSTNVSRGLRFRIPRVSTEKYSAVNYGGGAVEFRVFETCYHDPQVILDNLVVMKNCMKFWRTVRVKHGLAKITKAIEFGSDFDNTLDRFYYKVEHLDLLNKGLNLLKPSYYTISEIKEQRKFKKTKTTIKAEVNRETKKAELGYKEYENRFDWRCKAYYHMYLDSYFRDAGSRNIPLTEEKMRELEELARKEAKRSEKDKQPIGEYVKMTLEKLNEQRRGRYNLAEVE